MKAIHVDSLDDILRPKALNGATMRVHVKASDLDATALTDQQTPVPFLDLDAHHAPRRAEFNHAIQSVVDANAFAGGEFVERFEQKFAGYCECREAVGVGSGTEALWLALSALGIGPGDEVITVPMTFIATAEAISMTGATPVFVDVDDKYFTLDPAKLEDVVTSRTKAIIPVHLFGQAADMDPIMGFARERGIHVIEDAAQAHGARHRGRRVGAIGDIGCFSFYPGKNLGAFGDAGAAVTDDPDLAHRMRMLRDHGQDRKYHHAMTGWNCRMDGIQAAVLEIKLRDLDRHNGQRSGLAAFYDRQLVGMRGVLRPQRSRNSEHVYHLYVIRYPERQILIDAFQKRGIGFGIHYPVPIHLQEAYEHLGYRRGDFPVSEQCADEYLSLPMYPELKPGHIERVGEAIREAIGVHQPDDASWPFSLKSLSASENPDEHSDDPTQ